MIVVKEIETLEDTTLCEKCLEIVLDFFRSNDFDPLIKSEESFEEINESNNDLSCDCCKVKISIDQSYGIITINDDVIETIISNLGEDVGGCEYCEGNERGYLVNAYNNDPFDTSSRMEHPEGNMSVGEYLSWKGVPDELTKMMSSYFSCPSCGRGGKTIRFDPDQGTFNEWTDLYTKDEVNRFWGSGDDFNYYSFSQFLKNCGEIVFQDDFVEFKDHLSMHPMLGYLHPTGKAIYNALKTHFHRQEYSTIATGKGSLYRGRCRAIDSSRKYKPSEMWSPPEGLPGHGRFNSIGVPVLYVTDRVDAIPYEIHPNHENVVDIAKIKIMKELKIFDLGSFDPEFQGFFNEKNEDTKNLKKAYLLPNYIGNCCSYLGYNGVKYEGVHNISGSIYTNYALFNITKNDHLKINSVSTYKPKLDISLRLIKQKMTKASPTQTF